MRGAIEDSRAEIWADKSAISSSSDLARIGETKNKKQETIMIKNGKVFRTNNSTIMIYFYYEFEETPIGCDNCDDIVVECGSKCLGWSKYRVWCGSTLGGIINGTSVYSGNPEVNTALGCIPVKIDDFIIWLLPPVFGIAGGISFLLMVYAFFLMTTSSGDPKAVQGAWETITSAISGLLVSIFSMFILRLIAVGILKIPGIN